MTPHFLQNDAERLLALFARSNKEIINLSVAENILLFDRLDKIFTTKCCFKVGDIEYQSSFGEEDLRSFSDTRAVERFPKRCARRWEKRLS